MTADYLILVDPGHAEGRGRGILCCDTAGIDAGKVNALVTHARGLVAVAMTLERACALDLPPMRGAIQRGDRPMTLANVESIACKETGISARERALTLNALGGWGASPADFSSPGHIIVTVVPKRLPTEGSAPILSELAFQFFAKERGALAIAWSDILDDEGELADVEACRALAREIGAQLLETGALDKRIPAPSSAAA